MNAKKEDSDSGSAEKLPKYFVDIKKSSSGLDGILVAKELLVLCLEPTPNKIEIFRLMLNLSFCAKAPVCVSFLTRGNVYVDERDIEYIDEYKVRLKTGRYHNVQLACHGAIDEFNDHYGEEIEHIINGLYSSALRVVARCLIYWLEDRAVDIQPSLLSRVRDPEASQTDDANQADSMLISLKFKAGDLTGLDPRLLAKEAIHLLTSPESNDIELWRVLRLIAQYDGGPIQIGSLTWDTIEWFDETSYL